MVISAIPADERQFVFIKVESQVLSFAMLGNGINFGRIQMNITTLPLIHKISGIISCDLGNSDQKKPTAPFAFIMKKIFIPALILVHILFFSCKKSDDIIPEEVSRLSQLQLVNDTGMVVKEMNFEYQDGFLDRTVYIDYMGSNWPLGTSPYTLIDSFFYSSDGKLMMTSNTEQTTYICSLDIEFIYENNTLVRIDKDSDITSSEPEITFTRNGANQINGYGVSISNGVSPYNALVTLDNNNNIIDVVESFSGQGQSFISGAKGINEYDDMKTPFQSFDEEIRIYWSFGIPCRVMGEMTYGLGSNNRIKNTNNDSGLSHIYADFHYEYNDAQLPTELIVNTFSTFPVDTVLIYSEKYLYSYN